MSTIKVHKKPGRPKKSPTSVLTLRVSDETLAALDAWAEARGLNRNQAGQQLIEAGLCSPLPDGGYNPKTGGFDDD